MSANEVDSNDPAVMSSKRTMEQYVNQPIRPRKAHNALPGEVVLLPVVLLLPLLGSAARVPEA